MPIKIYCTAEPRINYGGPWTTDNYCYLEDLTNIPESIAEKLALLQLVAAGHPRDAMGTVYVGDIGGFWGNVGIQYLELHNCSQEEVAWFYAQREKR
jgi:hypothetical protein